MEDYAENTTQPNVSVVFDNSSSSESVFSTPDVSGALYVTIGTLGLVGNFIVVIVMCSRPSLRSKLINQYIINQSCIDFVVSINVIGLRGLSSEALSNPIHAQIHCLFWQSRVFLWGFMTSSTYNLVCLTLERYTGVVHPVWHKVHFTRQRALASMVAAWIFCVALEGAVKFSTAHIEDGQCLVYFTWPSSAAKALFGTVWILVKLIVPAITLIFCYGRIAFVLHHKVKERNEANNGVARTADDKFIRGRKNTIKTLFIVAVCFLVCWTWNQVHFFMFNLGVTFRFTTAVYHVQVMMVYLNTCINPFIYAFKYEKFQEAALSLFCRWNKLGKSANAVTDASSVATQSAVVSK